MAAGVPVGRLGHVGTCLLRVLGDAHLETCRLQVPRGAGVRPAALGRCDQQSQTRLKVYGTTAPLRFLQVLALEQA